MIGYKLCWKKIDFKMYMTIIFLLIPYFRPDVISEMLGESWINNLFTVWRILSFIYIALNYIFVIKHKKKIFSEGSLVIIILYEIVLLYSCIHNGVTISTRLVDMANFIGVYFIYRYYSKINSKILIKANFDLLFILVIINAVLTLVFPNGLNFAMVDSGRINFLGKDNIVTLVFILSIIFSVLYSNINSSSIRPLLMIITVAITELFYFSGSGIVSLAIIILYMCFLNRNQFINKILIPKLVVLIYLIFEILVVFFNYTNFLNFLFKWLHKSVTFTDRRYYWNTAIKQLLHSPIIGQGSGETFLWNNNYYSHNALLDVLLKGGVIGAVIWIILLLIVFKNVKGDKNLKIKGLFTISFFSLLLVGLMEGLEDRIIFNIFLCVVIALREFEKQDILKNAIVNTKVKVRKNE